MQTTSEIMWIMNFVGNSLFYWCLSFIFSLVLFRFEVNFSICSWQFSKNENELLKELLQQKDLSI